MSGMDAGATVTHIGKYPVLGILGVGGMGVVYRGMDKSVGREVAIKTLTNATEELRQRFLLEARSGVLNHPNIVTVYDFGEQDGNPYIVMEFVPGDSLENLLRDGRQFSMIEKLGIVYQTCLGLGYAHQKGVIHRDIKPANIMVQPDGNIKIVDFGVARLENLAGHTRTGMVIGTFHYIAPERLQGKKADGRADIWSVGIMLYQLLTGRLPFPGDDPSVLQRVVREPHEPMSSIVSGYPPALDQVVDHALAKSPIDRYETADDMAADLELINEGLKRDHVAEVLGGLQPLLDQQQWTTVRPILLDLQRLNPQNSELKKLLRDVQEKVARKQKTEQIRQLLGEAEEAVQSQRFTEAIEFYNQAAGLDRANPALAEKIEHVRALKEKSERIAAILEQARAARKRTEYEVAIQMMDQAILLDDQNVDLQNERSRIAQEADQVAKDRARTQLTDAGRGQLVNRQYTEAIKTLHAALEIDPSDADVQQMYREASERQEEQRRRKIIEQIVTEISECILAEDFDRAFGLIQRAQERLPGEAALLQLKTDAENRQQEVTAKKIVDQASLQVYSLFLSSPNEALAIVQNALAQLPGDPRLIALEERVVAQIQKANVEERKTQYLQRAQAAIDTKQLDQAVQILESATAECGEGPDIAFLLNYAREQRRKGQLKQTAASAAQEAQELIAAGNLEAAVALLQPVAAETRDPAVEQLLRQVSGSLDELNRHADAVWNRAQALSETDSDQALQFLANQASEIQCHTRIRALRGMLESKQERERQTTAAIRGANEALDRRDLRSGLAALESVQKTCGDSPQLSSAIAEHKIKRAQIANAAVTAAIDAATQAIQQNDKARAAEALSQVGDAAEFADAGLQTNLKRLNKQAGKISPAKPAKATADSGTAKAGFPPALLFGGIGVVALIVIVAAVWFLMPAKKVPMGTLELNATPFAEVVSITSEHGKALALPTGEHWTPLRLDEVPQGKYTVAFKGPDGATQNQQCDVTSTIQLCNVEMKAIDDNTLDEIVGAPK
jgi:serine/threonine-protein kinase